MMSEKLWLNCAGIRDRMNTSLSVLGVRPDHVCRKRSGGFHTACRLAGIEGLIWKDLRATFGTRLAEIGCDAFTIAQLLGHSDVRVTMRYVRTVEESKRAAVDAMQMNSRKKWPRIGHMAKQPPLPEAVLD